MQHLQGAWRAAAFMAIGSKWFTHAGFARSIRERDLDTWNPPFAYGEALAPYIQGASVEQTTHSHSDAVAKHLRKQLYDKVCVVTGANSGLGLELSKELAASGAIVHMIARNPERGREAADAVRACIFVNDSFPPEGSEQTPLVSVPQEGGSNTAPPPAVTNKTIADRVVLHLCDVSKKSDLIRLRDELSSTLDHIDCLVHNAGVMTSDEKILVTENEPPLERALATNTVATYRLTKLLLPLLRAASHSTPNTEESAAGAAAASAGLSQPTRESVDSAEATSPSHENQHKNRARVVIVSSGGGLSEGLLIRDEYERGQQDKWSGQTAYARTKRHQMVLAKLFQEKFFDAADFFSMHPGWVDTPGVQHSMPGFYKMMKRRLRTAQEGVDTMVFLLSYPQTKASRQDPMDPLMRLRGNFARDRNIERQHLPRAGTEYSDAQAEALWSWLGEIG